jgi:SAM-dependent methyltransferase
MMRRCPLCEGNDLRVFVERPSVPVHQNISYASAEAARGVPRGDLELACCGTCGFVMNLAFRSDLLQYGEGYENDQTNSTAFEAHMAGLIQTLVASGIRNKRIVELGCGQGQFLRRLCLAGDNNGVGFDPAYVGEASVHGGRVTFIRAFYGPGALTEPPDLLLCRHVIEHVPRPIELLRSVWSALSADRVTRLAFETPAVDWILEGTVIQDFFYEHCSYFTDESMRFAFERAGFGAFEASRVFGGQYLWAISERRIVGAPPARPVDARGIAAAAEGYQERAQARITTLSRGLVRLSRSGPLAVWGAGAKGVTFLNLLDGDRSLIDVAIDINPKKQQQFVAGTGHAIVAPREVMDRGIVNVIIMNPNYLNEVRQMLRGLGFTGHVQAEGDL